jgi:hypothetical protein
MVSELLITSPNLSKLALNDMESLCPSNELMILKGLVYDVKAA